MSAKILMPAWSSPARCVTVRSSSVVGWNYQYLYVPTQKGKSQLGYLALLISSANCRNKTFHKCLESEVIRSVLAVLELPGISPGLSTQDNLIYLLLIYLPLLEFTYSITQRKRVWILLCENSAKLPQSTGKWLRSVSKDQFICNRGVGWEGNSENC